MYHVKHDKTYMTFEGMNYPFGENIIFTDNQPFVANITKYLSQYSDAITCNLPAIHNLLLLVGLVLGGLGIFLCLRKLDVGFYFSLICAGGLMLLNPQIHRISAHFSMFYPILPWLFLLWIEYWKGANQLRNSIIIGGIIMCSGLLHMYYFITGAIFALLALFAVSVLKSKEFSIRTVLYSIFLQVLLPFIVLTFFSSYFNASPDRPTDPWGFFTYHSYWEGLMFSYKLPLYEFINFNIIEVRPLDMEGKNYIGIFSAFFVMYGLYLAIFRYSDFKTKVTGKNINTFWLMIFILSALISFGYPFAITGLEWLLDYTGPFKQFRSIGRVGWISFYAINLLAIPYIYRRMSLQYTKSVVYYAFPTILLIEGILFAVKVPLYQTPLESYNCDTKATIPIKSEEYQASITDPFFHIGSECFSWWDQAENINQAFLLGYQLGLPNIGVNMSRTSFKQSLLINELVNQPYKVPEIILSLKNISKKPLLVIESKHTISDNRAKISHWTKDAPVVFENDHFRLKKLSLESFEATVKAFNDSITTATPFVPRVKRPLSFDHLISEGKWGYETYVDVDSMMIGDFKLNYWIECPDATYVLSNTEIFQFDQNSNLLDYIGEGNRFNYKRIEGNKLWITTPFTIKPNTSRVVFRVRKYNQKKHHQLTIDDAEFVSMF